MWLNVLNTPQTIAMTYVDFKVTIEITVTCQILPCTLYSYVHKLLKYEWPEKYFLAMCVECKDIYFHMLHTSFNIQFYRYLLILPHFIFKSLRSIRH